MVDKSLLNRNCAAQDQNIAFLLMCNGLLNVCEFSILIACEVAYSYCGFLYQGERNHRSVNHNNL